MCNGYTRGKFFRVLSLLMTDDIKQLKQRVIVSSAPVLRSLQRSRV